MTIAAIILFALLALGFIMMYVLPGGNRMLFDIMVFIILAFIFYGLVQR